jgi:hypothetical protein
MYNNNPEQLQAAFDDPANWNKGIFTAGGWKITITRFEGAPREWSWDLKPTNNPDAQSYAGATGVDTEALAKAEAFAALSRQG